MTIKATTTATMALVASFACAAPALAQDLGPNVRKLADGVYAFVGENFNSNCRHCADAGRCRADRFRHNPVELRKLMRGRQEAHPDAGAASDR